jgi:hypothetical protein
LNLAYVPYAQVVGITFGPPQVALRGADRMLVLNQYIFSLACAAALLLLVAVVVGAACRMGSPSGSARKSRQILLASLLISAALAIGVAAATRINWQPRHAFFLFPPALLLLSSSVLEAAGMPRKWTREAAVSVLVLFAVTNLWSLFNYFVDPRYGKDDYRGAAKYLMEVRQNGTPGALLSGSAVLLRYYGDTATEDLNVASEARTLQRLGELTGAQGEVVVAINREFYWRGGVGAKAVLDSAFAISDHRKLQYFDFYRLGRRR